ncbi:MAG: methylenetetrahydrofolate reductase [NAD(P)H] [bacterium]
MQKKISEIYSYNTHVSFEFFPPKTSHGIKQIYQSIARLKNMNPDFFSVTYGAGGSTADKSLEIASALTNLAQVTCVAHLTCVGMNRDQVDVLLQSLAYHGIANVLALRGDPPAGDAKFIKPENGFAFAAELVRFIRERSDMGILVAGYPEGHSENPSRDEDFKHLVEKVAAGADGIVTQLFFENRFLFEMIENLDRASVKVPLLAGIFPISNAKQILRITELSGASVPEKLKLGLDKYADNADDMEKFGTDFAVEQIEALLAGGVKHFHFYTMNRHRQIRNILLQLRSYFPQLNLWE